MGQLEKYGLYVLCLVIFMILGVALWGDPATLAAERGASRGGSAPISAGGQPSATPAKDEKPKIGDKSLDDFFTADERAKKSSEEKSHIDPVKNVPPTPVLQPGVDKRTSYVIKAGDSYDSIARTQLKDASLRDLLIKLNPDMPPTRMRPGKEILLPSQAEIAARRLGPVGATTDAGTKPANADKSAAADKNAKDAKPESGKEPVKPVAPLADGQRTYTVKKGDTFERIATTELGSPKRTKELMSANPGIAPASLRAGQRITLPKK